MKMSFRFNKPSNRERWYALAFFLLIFVTCIVGELLKSYEVRSIAVELRTNFAVIEPGYRYEDIVRKKVLSSLAHYIPQKLFSRFKNASNDEYLSVEQKKDLQLIPIDDASYFKDRIKWAGAGRKQIIGHLNVAGHHNEYFSRIYREAVSELVTEFNEIYGKVLLDELFEEKCNVLQEANIYDLCLGNYQREPKHTDEFCSELSLKVEDVCNLLKKTIIPFHISFESEFTETILSRRNIVLAVILGFIAGSIGAVISIIFLRIFNIHGKE